ncbi:protocadherin gamma-B1-like [Eleutherodactylus coqui]|uniref:protocadherin gamma-B1-like n=1 Tax=Eleutherodactylus coqui TaxID=57060 RepID=UPI003462B2F7
MEPTIQCCTRLRWQVTISILFSWLCHSVSGQIHYSIVEEMRKDSVIANIADDLGLDVKQLSSRKLRIVSRVSEKYFYVNVDNGNLYIKDRIDRETLCGTEDSCYLTFDAVVENPLNIFKIKVDILDINDNFPQFYNDKITLEIIEFTSPGAIFVLQNAEDPDIGSNSVQTYKLSDNQYFTLTENIRTDGSKFPELVLEKPLDRETQEIHELKLSAMDGGNPIKSGTTLLKIVVTDANDNAPIFTQDMYKVTLKENIPVNSAVITLNATDNDEGVNAQITYSFIKTSGNVHHTGIFSINPITGEIQINENLDFEMTKNYEMSVQAKDGGGLVAHCKVLVDVIDENDNAPEISITSLSSPIPEDAAPGTMIALIEVHDQDSGDNAHVDCQVLEDVPFNLLSLDNYYKLVLKTTIDREKASSYNITIIATDRGSPPLSSRRRIELEISDVNDNPPLFTQSTYVAYVPENNLPGTSLFIIQATDPDSGDNAKIIYSISSSITEMLSMSSYLSINIETGVVYAQRSFDYEQNKEFMIEITASDNGFPSLSSNATLCIHIVDQNDNSPKILYPSPESGGSAVFEMVPFASEPGSLITKVVAVDADSGHNSWISYHFIQVSDPTHFMISERTGEIRTSRSFQEKDMMNYKVVVMVKDNGDPTLSATTTLSLIIADDFQQVVPKLSNKVKDEETQNNLQFYLVIALAIISLLFILTVMVVIISKCKQTKPLPAFSSLATNLYPPIDPRTYSMYSDGSLPFPYSYNVCVAFDSAEGDFTYMNPNGNVPVENLIDADNAEQGTGSLNESFPISEQEKDAGHHSLWTQKTRIQTDKQPERSIKGNNKPVQEQAKGPKHRSQSKKRSTGKGRTESGPGESRVSGQIHYSIEDEMRKDSLITNIADDLGLDIKQLSSRKLRIVSRASEKYFYINIKVDIQDINDNSPQFFHEKMTLETIEFKLPEVIFVLQNAEDPDVGINTVQTYKLSNN